MLTVNIRLVVSETFTSLNGIELRERVNKLEG